MGKFWGAYEDIFLATLNNNESIDPDSVKEAAQDRRKKGSPDSPIDLPLFLTSNLEEPSEGDCKAFLELIDKERSERMVRSPDQRKKKKVRVCESLRTSH